MTDDDLIRRLGAVFDEADPVPTDLFSNARLAYGWRTIDSELAELSYDSLVDREVMAAVRDDATDTLGPRLLGFGTVDAGEDVAIEVEVSDRAGPPALVGQLLPAGPATVHVQSVGRDDRPVRADDLGQFRIDPVPTGPVRLRVEFPARTVQTTWVSYVSG